MSSESREQLQAALADRYAIERELGRGGMATVYLARDLRHDRFVALKVLRPDLGAALGPERFTREIKLAAGLQHPHIVSVYDSGSTPGGLLWFTMPYVEGESLRARLEREKQLPLDDALQITHEVADALDYAHQQGIIHRDIKPENILLSRGHALVADFGVARAMSSGDIGGQPLTETGMAIGTPTYMSPEQATGERTLDARTDVYALGCVLYEMLSGEPPYTGATAQVILAKRVSGEVPSVRRLRPAVPASVDTALTKALAPVPADRFPSAGAFTRSLVSAGAAGGRTPAGSPHSRAHVLLAAAAFGIALLTGAGVLLGRRGRGPQHSAAAPGPVRLAVLPFENVGKADDDYFADGMADAVRGKLTALPGLQVIAAASSAQYKNTTKPSKRIGDELGVGYLLVGKVRWAKPVGSGPSRVQVSPELVEVANGSATWEQPFDAPLTDVFQVQADIAQKVAAQLRVALTGSTQRALANRPTSNLDAYDAYLRGRELGNSGAGPATLRRALPAFEEAVRRDSAFTFAWCSLADVHSLLYANGPSTPSDAQAARDAAARAVSLAPDLPEPHSTQGLYYGYVLKDYQKALAEYRKGLRIAPTNAVLLRRTGLVEMRLGRWDSAITHYQEALPIDPRDSWTVAGLGWNYMLQRRYADARTAYDRALVLQPTNLTWVEHRTAVSLAQGDLPGARAVLRAVPAVVDPAELVTATRAFEATPDVWMLDSAQLRLLISLTPAAFANNRAAWALTLAQAYALRGDQIRARAYADSSRVAYEKQLGATPRDARLRAYHGLALAYLGRKDAIDEGERAAALLPISADGVEGPIVEHQLARIYTLLGDQEKALVLLEHLLKVPYYLSPAWLRIDPNFAPLHGNPRFKRLIAQPATGERPTA